MSDATAGDHNVFQRARKSVGEGFSPEKYVEKIVARQRGATPSGDKSENGTGLN
jgi:hypothetical protein